MALPEDLEEAFRLDFTDFEKENQMQYVTSIERLALKEAEEKGRRMGTLDMIALNLEEKFGPSGMKVLRKVRALEDVRAMRKFARFLKKAETLDDVRAYFK
jgi:hypothetical protein